MVSVEEVVAKFDSFSILKLNLEEQFIHIQSNLTKTHYAHKWTELENPIVAVPAWIQRFVLGREEFHKLQVKRAK